MSETQADKTWCFDKSHVKPCFCRYWAHNEADRQRPQSAPPTREDAARELMANWRRDADIAACLGDSHHAHHLRRCADDLAALFPASEPEPHPTDDACENCGERREDVVLRAGYEVPLCDRCRQALDQDYRKDEPTP